MGIRVTDGSVGAALLGAACALALAGVLLALGGHGVGRSFADPDDAMRLVQVRDWTSGRGWYDRLQPRMQSPEGVRMHWSRVDDLPLAGIETAAGPWLGKEGAERAAMLAWPVALLVPLLALLAAAACRPRTGDPRVAALACSATCGSAALLERFAPGRVDHHALMTTLAAGAVSGLAWGTRRAGFLSGMAMATCLAVGFEDLAALGALGVATALAWAWGRAGDFAGGLFAGFAAGTAAATAAFAPPDWAVACDEATWRWAAVSVPGPAVLACAARMPLGLRGRVAALAGAALATVALAAGLLRPCASGPFAALDPTVAAYWLSRVGEMRDLATFSGGRVDVVLDAALAPVAALACAAAWLRGREGDAGARGRAYVAVLAVATLVGFRYVRNSGLPVALAAPVLGAAVARAVASGRRWRARGLAAVAALPLALAGLDVAYPDPTDVRKASERGACASGEAWSSLAALPPGTVLAPIDMGALVLAYTRHRTVAGGYHRAARGLRDVVEFMTSPADAAAAVVARDGVDYVAWCQTAAELRGPPDGTAVGMAADLGAGRLPPWLVPVGSDGPVSVARVDRGRLPVR